MYKWQICNWKQHVSGSSHKWRHHPRWQRNQYQWLCQSWQCRTKDTCLHQYAECVFGLLDHLITHKPSISTLESEAYIMYSQNRTSEWLRFVRLFFLFGFFTRIGFTSSWLPRTWTTFSAMKMLSWRRMLLVWMENPLPVPLGAMWRRPLRPPSPISGRCFRSLRRLANMQKQNPAQGKGNKRQFEDVDSDSANTSGNELEDFFPPSSEKLAADDANWLSEFCDDLDAILRFLHRFGKVFLICMLYAYSWACESQ